VISVSRICAFLVPASLLLVGAAAAAAGRVAITITNNGPDDVFVTVHDVNAHPHTKVLAAQRINGFASVPISVTANAAGAGHVSWTAATADPNVHKCGHGNKSALVNDNSVHVYAHSNCPVRAHHQVSVN